MITDNTNPQSDDSFRSGNIVSLTDFRQHLKVVSIQEIRSIVENSSRSSDDGIRYQHFRTFAL